MQLTGVVLIFETGTAALTPCRASAKLKRNRPGLCKQTPKQAPHSASEFHFHVHLNYETTYNALVSLGTINENSFAVGSISRLWASRENRCIERERGFSV